jgi:hypothetical protein
MKRRQPAQMCEPNGREGMAEPFPGWRNTGAGGGNRTPDIQLGKLTFYL